eukprot:GHVT01083443.1.p1 GENE.GHVT01083443.1~~GHVT01083443.1.p1  ORF type:complete len:104 (-),score=0.37 GHVT01083443.1:66-377(-)
MYSQGIVQQVQQVNHLEQHVFFSLRPDVFYLNIAVRGTEIQFCNIRNKCVHTHKDLNNCPKYTKHQTHNFMQKRIPGNKIVKNSSATLSVKAFLSFFTAFSFR